MFTGVGHQKNDLGLMCLTAGIYFAGSSCSKRDDGEAAAKTAWFELLMIGMMA